MTRGRKKDMTIPPTRALVQQRDYRARKAHYVSELEERCRKAEDENAQLRKDLELARASLSVPYLFNPLAAELSSELQHNISLVSSSLARFQDFAKQHPLPAGPSRGVQLPPIQDCLRPPSLSQTPLPSVPLRSSPSHHTSPPPYPSQPPYATQPFNHHPDSLPRGRKRLCREESPSSSRSDSGPASTSSRYEPTRSSSPESECCGGIFDCSELCEEEHDHAARSPPSSRYRYSDRAPPRYAFPKPPQHESIS
ncbi:hypothetical protein DFP72DRAFT_1063139 [Ephemerocybe angulata]|uniref:BZIP domain-containing protein n=1 Tax=Ephemerocybe angulata TaxID=980116 RepID=A0A8H6MCH2_9AGAR|nr:hypothetical protein DFP72DRAFT_1063139 [Tulosesus angulatus]